MNKNNFVVLSIFVVFVTSGCAKRNDFQLKGDLTSQNDVVIEYQVSQEEHDRDSAAKNLAKAAVVSAPTILTIATGGAAFPLMLIQYLFTRP